MIVNLTKKEWAPFDDAMKSWRGPHPYRKGETIGYWVLRGWFEIEEERAEKEYPLLQKKRYAQQKIGSWYPKFKAGEITKETIELKEAEDFYELQILIYDEDRIRAPSSEIELYEADVIQIAEGVRSAFKTPGYERSWHKALFLGITRGIVSKFVFVGLNALKSVPLALKSFVDDWRASDQKLSPSKNFELFKTSFLKAFDQSVEVLSIAAVWAQDMLLRVILPFGIFLIISHFGIIPGLGGSLNGFIAKLFIGQSEGLLAKGTGFLISTVIAIVFGTALKKFFDGRSTNQFKLVTQDIFAGAVTPEKMESRYNEKIQDIMDNPDLSWKEMKDQMLEVHKEFQLEVRPAIEKGLYLSGTMSDQAGKKFFDEAEVWYDKATEGMANMFTAIKNKFSGGGKKGSSASLPISLKIVQAKAMLTLKADLEDYMKNGEGATLIYKILSGEEPIDEEIKEHVQMNSALVASVQKELEANVDLSQFSVAN
jgi:hypothetical protein